MGFLRRIAKKAKNDRPALVALVGDLHINSTVGLPPGLTWPKDDGGTYHASKTQRWILEAWLDYWSIIDAKQKEHDAELFVIVNGEVTDGDHHDTRQIITRMESEWLAMGAKILDPVAQRTKPENLFILRGTEAHSGKSGSWDEAIAKDLGAHPSRHTMDGEVAAHSWDHLRVSFRGVKCDIKHHTTKSRVPRSKGSSAGRKAADTMVTYINHGEWPPQLVVRAHVHGTEDSRDTHTTRVIILPCWQASTAFGHKITDELPDIGGAWALCQDGQYEADVIKYPYGKEAIKWIEF